MHEEYLKITYKDMELAIAVKSRITGKYPLVFIHGLGCAKDFFDHIWDIPEFRRFTIMTFDLPGFGNSSKPESFSYDMKEQAKICNLIIDKTGLENINLVGHSMGAAIALLMTADLPDRFLSIINLEGNLISEDCGISKLTSDLPYQKFRGSFFDRLKRMANSSSELWYKSICRSTSNAFYRSSKSLVEWSSSGKLLDIFNNMVIRRYYFYGSENHNLPVLKAIKDSITKIQVSKSGHFMMLDNPHEFYKKLLEVINGIQV